MQNAGRPGTFFGFVTKEFRQIYRDRRTLTVLVGMPVIMMILFGYAIRNEVSDASVAVLDFSGDAPARQLVQKIDASRYFTVAGYLEQYGEIEPLMQSGSVDEVLVIPADFAATMRRGQSPVIQVITDASNPNLSRLVQEYTAAIIRSSGQAPGQSGETPKRGAALNVMMLFNPALESVNLFVPGLIAVILMLICTLMTSISITREKEMGNMEMLLVSPLRPLHIITGKVLPYLILAFADVLIILFLARTVFDVPVRGSWTLLLLESLLFIFVALALGVLISARANSQQTAMMVSLAGLLLPTVLLSGFIFPLSSMPLPLQWLSNLIPARWFLEVVRSIMLKEAGFEHLWRETAILAGMLAVITAAGIKSFKLRLE